MDRLNNRLDTVEDIVSELENRYKEFVSYYGDTKNNMNKWEKDMGYRMGNLTNVI